MSNGSEEITILPNTKYWVYVLQNNHWEHLSELFKKNKFYISSFKNYSIKENDIIFVYQKHRSTLKIGFVAICQTSTKMIFNEKNKIKIFKDMNMNRYFVELGIVLPFNDPYRMSTIEKHLGKNDDFRTSSFRNDHLKEASAFSEINKDIGRNLLKILVELSDEAPPETSNDNIDSYDENEESEESELSELSEQDNTESDDNISDDDEILVVDGHIPIMMIPCQEFEWNKDSEVTIENFKTHYKNCSKCQKTDNNDVSFLPVLESSEIYCKEIKKDEEIEEYVDCYHELRKYMFKLADEDKQYSHVYLFRINHRGDTYHKCILIIW